MRLLALECATEHCSVALWLDGVVCERRQTARGPAHGEALLPMVEALLAEAQLPLAGLDAVAVGRGPGAFTGVRLGISVAQGLAFSRDLPVFAISTLAAVARAAGELVPAAAAVLVCQDARMGELYTARYRLCDQLPVLAGEERLCGPAQLAALPDPVLPGWVGAGSGWAAHPSLAGQLGAGLLQVVADALPQARHVAWLAERAGLAAALPAERLQPVYLRDSVAQVPLVNKPS